MKAIKLLITLFWLPSDLILAYAMGFTRKAIFIILFILFNAACCISYYLVGIKEIEEKEKEKEKNGKK